MKKAVAAVAARSNTHGAEATAALYPYVERTATVADSFLEWDGRQTYIHYTLLRVSRTLANSQAVGALNQQRVDPWLQLPAKRRALGESQVSTTGRANKFKATVAVKSADPHDGYFDLKFSVRPSAGRMVVRLVEIKPIQDGSLGKASWQFEVRVNGEPAFILRSRDYDNDMLPVAFSASEPVETSIAVSANQKVLITVRASRTKEA
jgi:hypothetical protein